jgi:hypothetical protein
VANLERHILHGAEFAVALAQTGSLQRERCHGVVDSFWARAGRVRDASGKPAGRAALAMPPMVSAAILAEQYQLEPALAGSVLGIGILLSLVTVPRINPLL